MRSNPWPMGQHALARAEGLKLTGVAALPSRHVSRLSPEWQGSRSSAQTAAAGKPLTPPPPVLGAWPCASRSPKKPSINLPTSSSNHGLRARPRQAYRDSCRAWNWAVEQRARLASHHHRGSRSPQPVLAPWKSSRIRSRLTLTPCSRPPSARTSCRQRAGARSKL